MGLVLAACYGTVKDADSGTLNDIFTLYLVQFKLATLSYLVHLKSEYPIRKVPRFPSAELRHSRIGRPFPLPPPLSDCRWIVG